MAFYRAVALALALALALAKSWLNLQKVKIHPDYHLLVLNFIP